MLFQIAPSAVPAGYGETLLPRAACKAWLRIVNDDDLDELIDALRDAAVDAVEQYTGLYLGPRAATMRLATFPAGPIRVGRGPETTIAVQSITYADASGAAAVLPEGAWRVTAAGVEPAPGSNWPGGASDVAITFSAGFPAGQCPSTLLTAAKMFLAHLFANPEAVVTHGAVGEVPLGFRMLCDPHRLIAL